MRRVLCDSSLNRLFLVSLAITINGVSRSPILNRSEIALTTRTQGQTFWTVLLPQMIQISPAVKHLVVATASLHENALGVPTNEDFLSLFTTHYVKALECINDQSLASSEEIILISCALISVCESIRLDYQEYLRHAEA